MVKLRFLLGLAKKIADTNGIGDFPQVRETLGQLAAETAMVEGMVIGMEASGWHYGKYFIPNKKLLYSAMVLTQQLYPKFVDHAPRAVGRRHDHAAFVGRRTSPTRNWPTISARPSARR